MTAPRFARPGDVVRLELREFDGSDDWVEVRAALSWGDMLAIRRAAMPRATAAPGGAGGMQVDIDVGARQAELLTRAIVRWSFRAGEGDPAPLPVTRELILSLDSRLADWLAERLEVTYGAGDAGAGGVAPRTV